MSIDQLESEEDQIIALLKQLVANTSGGVGSVQERTVNIERNFSGGSPTPVGAFDPRRYTIKETADLEDANESGAIELEPGEWTTIAEADSQDGVILLAVGAADKRNVRYRLYMDDQRTIGNATNAPLGTIHAPFSFYEKFGALLPANRRIEYQAKLDDSVAESVELVGTLHVLQA